MHILELSFLTRLTWWYQEDVICWANLPAAIVQWVGAHLKVTGTWNKKRPPNLPVSYPGVGINLKLITRNQLWLLERSQP